MWMEYGEHDIQRSNERHNNESTTVFEDTSLSKKQIIILLVTKYERQESKAKTKAGL